MKGAIKITVTPNYKRVIRETDYHGKRLSKEEYDAQLVNPYVGSAKVEFATENMLLIATIAKVWRNRDSMAVSFDSNSVKIGEDVREWIERAAIQAMHGVETSEWFG